LAQALSLKRGSRPPPGFRLNPQNEIDAEIWGDESWSR